MNIAFDAHPTVYWLAGYTIALLLCLVVYGATKAAPSNFERPFLFISGLLLVMMRLPVIFFNRELNADESQMLTQGMTLSHDPLYFRSVDGTTGGPLGSYFLLIPGAIRGSFDYAAAHFGALMLVFVALTFLYFALRNWFGKLTAMVAILPAVLFFAFNQQEDFVHYSSEHVPVALMGVIAYLFSTLHKRTDSRIITALAVGALIALLPFGKLQTLPMVLVLVLWGIYIVWQRGRLFSEGAAFAGGGVAMLVLLILIMSIAGIREDFMTYYIQANFQYGGDKSSWWENLVNLPTGLGQTPSLIYFLIPPIVLVLYALLRKKERPVVRVHLFFFPVLWIIFTLLAISRTGSGYFHYWLFTITPITLFIANYIEIYKARTFVVVGFALMSTGCCFIYPVTRLINHETLNKYISAPGVNRSLPFTPIAQEILKYGKPGEHLVVWGWNCQFYVETQMPQGVAENHSIRSIFKHPMQDTYLARYRNDIIRTKPVVILDAVGKNSLWVQDKKTQGIENYPALSAYILQNYRMVKVVDDARLYVRKDRVN